MHANSNFIRLLNENGRIIDRISCMYVDHKEDREDLKQEICLQLWRSFQNFSGKSAFSTWLYKVALNTALTFFKKEKKRLDKHTEQCAEIKEVLDLELSAEHKEQVEIMYQAIGKLPKLDRALVALYLDEKNYDEISEILGITPVNARVKISRLKEKLKTMINP